MRLRVARTTHPTRPDDTVVIDDDASGEEQVREEQVREERVRKEPVRQVQ